jgi:fatty-acyl-CoA synthase
LLGLRIGDLVDRACEKWPDRTAFVSTHEGRSVDFAHLKTRVDNFAAGLLRVGLKPGDRVGIWAPNCFDWFLSQMAIAKAGMISVNVNPAYQVSLFSD